jgi:hypothetical protein
MTHTYVIRHQRVKAFWLLLVPHAWALKEISSLLTEYVYKSFVILTTMIVFLYNFNQLLMGMFSVDIGTEFLALFKSFSYG